MKRRHGLDGLILGCLLAAMPFPGAFAQARGEVPAGYASVPLPRGLSPETADLVVKGRIGKTEAVCLDLATIMALPPLTFRSIDPWDGKEHSFTGASLRGTLAWLGIEEGATKLNLTAKNKYTIPIKRDDFEKHDYILAYMMDGKAFGADPSTRKRGPIAIALDFSKDKDLSLDLYKHQLVWQLAEILVQ